MNVHILIINMLFSIYLDFYLEKLFLLVW